MTELLQLGFDLAMPSMPPKTNLVPPGVWEKNYASYAVQSTQLRRAQAALAKFNGDLRTRYTAGIERLHAQLSGMAERDKDWPDEPFCWQEVHWDLTPIKQARFNTFCEQLQSAGAEVKRRSDYHVLQFGLYVEPLGSLLMTAWPNGKAYLEYRLMRDRFFLPSHRDGCARYEVSADVWGRFCGGMTCSESTTDKPPGVSVFKFQGQQYVITGGYSHGDYYECGSWRVIPRHDWAGPLYSSRQLVNLYNEGSIERGDKRGLLVTVRGQSYVLSDFTVFYDTHYVVRERPKRKKVRRRSK